MLESSLGLRADVVLGPITGKRLGSFGELIARKELSKAGFRIIETNWRCRAGEIDIVAWDGEELVFIEVKTRTDSTYARRRLFDTITYSKKKKLRQLAEIYARTHYRRKRPRSRIDVVGVVVPTKWYCAVTIKHLRGVYTPRH